MVLRYEVDRSRRDRHPQPPGGHERPQSRDVRATRAGLPRRAPGPEVRCVVLTGNGRAFCSGDDVSRSCSANSVSETVTAPADAKPKPTPAATAVLECDKPVIAAVNGAAVGWGMDLTLFADIRIASEARGSANCSSSAGWCPTSAGCGGCRGSSGLEGSGTALHRRHHLRAGGRAHRARLESRAARRTDGDGDGDGEEDRRQPAHRPSLHEGRSAPLGARKHGRDGRIRRHSLAYLFTTEDHREGALSFVERREPVFKGRLHRRARTSSGGAASSRSTPVKFDRDAQIARRHAPLAYRDLTQRAGGGPGLPLRGVAPMHTLNTRINTAILIVIALTGFAIVTMLATRAHGGPLDPPGAPGADAT